MESHVTAVANELRKSVRKPEGEIRLRQRVSNREALEVSRAVVVLPSSSTFPVAPTWSTGHP
jgi:hypothetical protein